MDFSIFHLDKRDCLLTLDAQPRSWVADMYSWGSMVSKIIMGPPHLSPFAVAGTSVSSPVIMASVPYLNSSVTDFGPDILIEDIFDSSKDEFDIRLHGWEPCFANWALPM